MPNPFEFIKNKILGKPQEPEALKLQIPYGENFVQLDNHID
jgi:hypothetical protein